MKRRTERQRATSIAITERLNGTFRVAIFPRDAMMDSIPQDYPTLDEAKAYATRLSAVTGWHIVDRTGDASRPILRLRIGEHGQG